MLEIKMSININEIYDAFGEDSKLLIIRDVNIGRKAVVSEDIVRKMIIHIIDLLYGEKYDSIRFTKTLS